MKQEIAAVTMPPAAAPPVRVAMVEDQPKIRESWTRLIDSFPDFKCLGACTSAEEAVEVVPTLQPDIILMDILLPGMSGIECTTRLKVLLPQTLIVILTAVDDDELVFRALEAGADGYLLKRTRPEELRTALLDVLSGGAPMTSAIARRVVQSFRRASPARTEEVRLSAREAEVLGLLAKGYTNKEIAEEIHLSVETVRSYLKHIYEKMHVRSRTQAVIKYAHSRPGNPAS